MLSSPFWNSRPCFVLCLILILFVHATSFEEDGSGDPYVGHLVKRHELKPLISTEFGRVSGAKVSDGNETFLLHVITLEPNSLFLPALLHQDMVFYVNTGSGMLSYGADNKLETVDLTRGDVFRLESGSVFFIQSGLDPGRQKLRIHAIFGDAGEDLRDPAPFGSYSSVRDLVLGFDERTLQEAFKVPEEVIEEIRGGPKPEAITHGIPSTEKSKNKREYEFMESVISRSTYGFFDPVNKGKKKKPLYNFFHEKPDFQNCNGWSTTFTNKKSSLMRGSKFGLFMVNLTQGGMMGPHWNPRATEIAVVLQGRGMIRVVCPSIVAGSECKSSRFAVEEGDIFVVPRFHPMAQLAFNNDTFVFMGFSTSPKNNHPQYLAGKASVFRTLNNHILATSFGVNDTTLGMIMDKQGESVILECLSCAEGEYRIMSEEIQREREEARRREEEEARRRQEEERRKEEEAKKREEEEARRQEEEATRKREEDERRKREQEEAERKQREEEEEAKRRQREEEEARGREKQKKEEEEARRREEEAIRKREAEERRKREQEEEAERKRQQQQQEEEARKKEEQVAREEAARREEEAARREQEEAQKRQQEAGQGGGGGGGRSQEEAQREEEAARKQEEETTGAQEQGGGSTGRARRIMIQKS